ADIGAKRGEGPLLRLSLQALRRQRGQALALGKQVHRRYLFGHASAGRSRRLGVDGCDLVPGCDERGQRRQRKLRGAHENDTHCGGSDLSPPAMRIIETVVARGLTPAYAVSSALACFLNLRTMMSRLSRDKKSMMSLPFRWSISCWMAVASSPSAVSSCGSPSRS